jgi:SlyX protein
MIPMSETKMLEMKTLNDRIDLLETRLAFQDETIETLNKTITEQWLKIDALTRRLEGLSERLEVAESRVPGAANEPPPHY